MTIYILDQDLAKSAQYLDDKSLEQSIKDIAQVLCNVHIFILQDSAEGRQYKQEQFNGYCMASNQYYNKISKIPLNKIKDEDIRKCKWSKWARECNANYLWLVEHGEVCGRELNYRFEGLTEKQVQLEKILIWTRGNVPDLSEGDIILDNSISTLSRPKQFPLIMPKKYIHECFKYYRPNAIDRNVMIVKSYCSYYQAKLEQKIKVCCALTFTERCMNCLGSNGYDIPFKWTNRDKPRWLTI